MLINTGLRQPTKEKWGHPSHLETLADCLFLLAGTFFLRNLVSLAPVADRASERLKTVARQKRFSKPEPPPVIPRWRVTLPPDQRPERRFLTYVLNFSDGRRNCIPGAGMMDVATRLLEPILVMQAQLGNTAAFSQLVSGHHASLRYYVRRIVGGKGGGHGIGAMLDRQINEVADRRTFRLGGSS